MLAEWITQAVVFGRYMITRELPTFLLFVVVISLSTAGLTILASPQIHEDSSKSSSNSLGVEGSQADLAGKSPLTSTGLEVLELRVSVEPPAGGEVILTRLSIPAVEQVKGQSPSTFSSVAEPATDSLIIRHLPRGMQVKLEAVPREGFLFSRWDLGCRGARLNVCVVTITENVYATAQFVEASAAQSSGGY